MINVIVSIATALASGFVLLWFLRPSFRKWVEQPKYTIIAYDRLFQEIGIPERGERFIEDIDDSDV